MKIYDIIIAPLLTEKTNIQREKFNIYTFKVAKKANKKEVENTIEKLFNIKPRLCRILNMKGKMKRVISKKGQAVGMGCSSSWKKAYVYLNEKDKLDILKEI